MCARAILLLTFRRCRLCSPSAFPARCSNPLHPERSVRPEIVWRPARWTRSPRISGLPLADEFRHQAGVKAFYTFFRAVPAFLHSAEWRLRNRNLIRVQPNHSRLELLAQELHRTLRIGERKRRKTVWQAVGLLHHRVEIRK